MIGGISMKEELIDNLLNYFINENKDIFDKSLLRADQVDYDYFD